jgi:hypothetical protein
MRLTFLALVLGVLVAAPSLAADEAALPAQPSTSAADDPDLSQQISRLVRQLNDDRAAQREAAEKALLELGGAGAGQSDRFLELLPEATDEMPLAVRERLARIRREVQERAAKAAVEQSTVTLQANKMPLTEALSAIHKQTGNKLTLRDEPPESGGPTVTIDFRDEPFWSAVDQVLDQASLGVYNYSGEDALSLVPRDPNDGPRHGSADYTGPFRIEVLEIQAQRNLRQPQRKSLKVQFEVAWEPRLRPIAISQPVADIEATDEEGAPLAVSQPEASLDVEVPGGTQAAEIILPFDLPPRETAKIAKLTGRLTALVPGRTVKFRFDELPQAAGKSQRSGGVEVTLDDVRKNNEIWEVHMRLRLDESNRALESHRGWVFQNVSYLVGKDGEPIDHAGFETTRQTPNEVGVAYLFDLPAGIEGLSWVYETPAAIIDLPVEYELTDIALP